MGTHHRVLRTQVVNYESSTNGAGHVEQVDDDSPTKNNSQRFRISRDATGLVSKQHLRLGCKKARTYLRLLKSRVRTIEIWSVRTNTAVANMDGPGMI